MRCFQLTFFAVAAALLVGFRGYAHAESRTNKLIRAMLQGSLVRPHYDGLTQTVSTGPGLKASQRDFFSGDEDWTAEEKRSVFDWYLTNLAVTARSYGMTRERTLVENPLACAAVAQCEAMGYTNAIPSLYEIARGCSDPSRIAAIGLLLKWDEFDGSVVSLVDAVTTNCVRYSDGERNAVYRMFCDNLLRFCNGAGVQAGSARDAGESLMFERRRDPLGAVAIDKMLMSCRQGYSNSLERYETACAVLTNENARSNCIRYFISITNAISGLVTYPKANLPN